jgi:hypothetical protein
MKNLMSASRTIQLTATFVAALLVSALTACSSKPPDCTDPQAVATAKEIVLREARKLYEESYVPGFDKSAVDPAFAAYLKAMEVKLDEIVSNGYSSESKKHSCAGKLAASVPGKGGYSIRTSYTLQATADGAGKFYVELDNAMPVISGMVGDFQTRLANGLIPLETPRPQRESAASPSVTPAPVASANEAQPPTGSLDSPSSGLGRTSPRPQPARDMNCGADQAACAATLERVVGSFALPANANYSANDWSETNAIAGVQWQHKGLKETPVSPFTRLGRIKLDGLPVATVFFSGARTMVTQLTVIVGGNGAPVIEKEDFSKAMRAQFYNGRIRQLRGGCVSEGGAAGSAVYEVTLPAKKPVYLLLETDAGGSSPDSRSTTFQFQLEPQERWACKP